jgi:3-oxoacyl-(acyl-carrier-protein) synthase
MKHRRVKITGIGPVTPAGIGREAFLNGMLEPVSRVGAMKLGTGDQSSLVAAAEVKDFRVGAFALDAVHLQSPRHIQFALAATVLALRDAGISLPDVRKRKPLVVVAYPMAERLSFAEPAKETSAENKKPNLVQEAVAEFVGARAGGPDGRCFFSSIEAVGYAAECVASGEVDLAICGGADAPLTTEILAEMKRFGFSPGHAKESGRVCRPFDLWRTTGVAGEGACLFVLEPERSPQRAHARVAGSAWATEKADCPWEALSEALRLALGNAGLRPVDIDCIHADGTGHKRLDQAEANVLREWLGTRLESVPVVSIKGAIGNALGAAGAIQIGCAALGMRHSTIPPTVNWHHPDPSCPLNLSGTSRLLAIGATLIVGRDPAGTVASLILKS